MNLLTLHDPETPELIAHISGGLGAIVFGTLALSFEKGGFVHRLAGHAFALSMLVMATFGAHLALLMQRGGLFVGGTLTCYLIATAWMTVRRTENSIGLFERIAPLLAFGVAILCASYGIRALQTPHEMFQGVPAPAYLSQAAVAVLAGVFDIKVVLRGGISGKQRIARHLWRMSLAFFEATSAFFIGQQKVMPSFVHGSPILVILGLAPIGVMVFWLVRVSWTRRYQAAEDSVAFSHQRQT